ncbi:MAG: hypothetical protein CVV06_11835 [Gammaproteobacteria bacterium HGW-Gammaproteobacteria-10]|nr:MAG: hypothetical protein CVV06_11835 [Gammaproteobacteria bacterium HGW-Gammaproteobacteria-10]
MGLLRFSTNSPDALKTTTKLKPGIAGLILLLLQLNGCATPSERFESSAKSLGLTSIEIIGEPFRHRIYLNRRTAAQSAPHPVVHVYLDGDGTPWEMNRWIAEDPTPRNPLILHLMAADKEPAILLGRPCYYGLHSTENCHYSLWTSKRYSTEVVESMASALRKWLTNTKAANVVLIGYSGGGTLATLLTPYFKNTSIVVTIAANLNTSAWSRHHAYLPLDASLNPIDAQPLPAEIKQIHLAGVNDSNVPASIVESFSRRQTNVVYLPIDGFDHVCCWADLWPDILKRYIAPRLSARIDYQPGR